MTSTPSQTTGRYDCGPGTGGLVLFSAVLLSLLALFNLLHGLSAINRSSIYILNAHYVIGDLRAWGWVMVAFAILLGFVVREIIRGSQWARWFGIVVLGLNALSQMFFVPSYPVWSVLIIALDVLALFGLTAHWGHPVGSAEEKPAQKPAQKPAA